MPEGTLWRGGSSVSRADHKILCPVDSKPTKFDSACVGGPMLNLVGNSPETNQMQGTTITIT